MSFRKRLGFTLVELLVVISIIGLLATSAFIGVSYSAKRARDTRRKADLRQLQKAVELYYDENQTYPNTSGSWYGTCAGSGNVVSGVTGAGGYIPGLAPTYMPILPTEPKPSVKLPNIPCAAITQDCYVYRSDGSTYKIASTCGIETTYPNTNDPFYDGAATNYRIAVCGGSDPTTACNSW